MLGYLLPKHADGYFTVIVFRVILSGVRRQWIEFLRLGADTPALTNRRLKCHNRAINGANTIPIVS